MESGNIIMLLLMLIGGSTGIISTLYLAISFPAVIIWKLYRKARHGYALTS